jgi:hypothetical protein
MEDRYQPPVGPPFADAFPQPQPIDPENPRWGLGATIGVWLLSAALIILEVAARIIIATMPEPPKVQITKESAIASIFFTLFWHIVTIIVCWVVVTGKGRQPFFQSMGWHWGGLSVARRIAMVVVVVALMVGLQIALPQILPDSGNTDFEQLLRTSATVRLMVALVAVLSAPIVEEVIYRGVLYAGLRKRIGIQSSVIIVTVLFTAVHLPQYWGAWASITALTILSLILTLIRARSKSLLPCVVVHMAYNMFGAAEILLSKWE